MGNLMSMAVAEGLYDLDKYFPGIVFWEVAFRIEAIEELPAFTETIITVILLSNKENVMLIFKGFIKFNAWGVIQRFQDFDLVQQ
jgi:hypothetical protein